MLGHISFGVEDLDRAVRFYDAALSPLGLVRVWSTERSAGWGPDGKGDLLAVFRHAGKAHAPGPGFHLAINAPDRKAVDAFHAAALKAGGTDDGAPGIRAKYSPTYYAAFVIDPDGNNLELVCDKE